jgi:hypothetical protein
MPAVGFGLPLTSLDRGNSPLLGGLRAVGPAWLMGGTHRPEACVVCLAYFALATVEFWPKPRRESANV